MAFHDNFVESQWPYWYDPKSYPTQSLTSYPSSPNLTQNLPNHCTSYYLDSQPPISETNYYYIAPSSSSSSSSHSTSAPDDVFEEYDPDPYIGGYDIVQTYGKPLRPSDQTCYPRSSAPDPKGVSHETGEVVTTEGTKKGGNESASVGNNDASRFYGSGLEGVDLCGGVFGYWPCWEKHKGKGNGFGHEKCNSSGNGDEDSPWNDCKSVADYIFGSPFGYGELSYIYQQEYQRDW